MFLLHYWEAEVRKFVGQGWTVEWPTPGRTGAMSKRRTRLTGVVEQVRARSEQVKKLEAAAEPSKKDQKRLKELEHQKVAVDESNKKKVAA